MILRTKVSNTIHHIHRKPVPILKRHDVCRTYSDISLVDASYYLGKGIILYTMLYCGLNYFMYKSMYDEYEKSKDEDNIE